jgi:hypothetical protein
VAVFHGLTSVLFPIGIFPWLMIGLTPIFLDPSWPRRWLGRAGEGVPPRVVTLVYERPLMAMLALHLLLQTLIPLRAFVESDDVAWTEQGFRFAWRVMAMEKAGIGDVSPARPRDGEDWTVDPRAELTTLQTDMMATQPDMIADYARHLAAEARRAGHADVEVRADVFVSLNGRPNRRFVDPDADLASAARRARARAAARRASPRRGGARRARPPTRGRRTSRASRRPRPPSTAARAEQRDDLQHDQHATPRVTARRVAGAVVAPRRRRPSPQQRDLDRRTR